ncbi:MAG TPA: histidine kinase [Stellaceae bacterium]|nr:histidine kinase [Stellaceae bacterium]
MTPLALARPVIRVSERAAHRLLQLGFWLAFWAVMVAWGLSYWPPLDAFAEKTILTLLGFALAKAGHALQRAARAQGAGPPLAIALAVGFSFALSPVWIEATGLGFQLWLHLFRGSATALGTTGIPFGNFLFFGAVLLVWSVLDLGLVAWIELDRERGRTLAAEAAARAARLEALRAQLEPHFLFNTLNAVSTLVGEGESAAAQRMIARLGDLLRRTLDTAERAEIPLAEEFDFVRAYIDIQQMRFGERLRVVIEADPGLDAAPVPGFVLQPLVENAIKHAVQPREAGGRITVRAERSAGRLRLTVADDGDGCTSIPPWPPGHGLANLAARLAVIHGDAAELLFARSAAGGCEAVVTLPLRSP